MWVYVSVSVVNDCVYVVYVLFVPKKIVYFILGVDSARVATRAGRVLFAPVFQTACFLPLTLSHIVPFSLSRNLKHYRGKSFCHPGRSPSVNLTNIFILKLKFIEHECPGKGRFWLLKAGDISVPHRRLPVHQHSCVSTLIIYFSVPHLSMYLLSFFCSLLLTRLLWTACRYF